ncbi:MAG TPA: hypothetical protein VH559_16135 [Gemmatimonadaceae bacterium]
MERRADRAVSVYRTGGRSPTGIESAPRGTVGDFGVGKNPHKSTRTFTLLECRDLRANNPRNQLA